MKIDSILLFARCGYALAGCQELSSDTTKACIQTADGKFNASN